MFGYEKPRRVETSEGIRSRLLFLLTAALYMRTLFVLSLPMVRAYQMIPVLRTLVFLAAAPGTRLGRHSRVLGTVYDPDLTEIGERAVIGAGCSLTAHSFTTNPNG